MDVEKAENLDELVADHTELNSIPVLKKAIGAVEETGDLTAFRNNLAYLERSHQLDSKMSKAILNAAEARKGYYAALEDFRRLSRNTLNSGLNPELLGPLTSMAYHKIREGMANLDQFIIHMKQVWNKTDLTSEERELVERAWKQGKEDADNGVVKNVDEIDEITETSKTKENGKFEESRLNEENTIKIGSTIEYKVFDFKIKDATPDQLAALDHAIKRHGKELSELMGKPIAWTKKENLQSVLDNFNEAVSLLRKKGDLKGQSWQPYAKRGEKISSVSTIVDVYIYTHSNEKIYYLYLRVTDQKFVSGGLKTKI